MDDEFNSSNIEFDVPPQPFPRAGQKLMKAMIENKDRDRLETDERLRILDEKRRTLGDTSGAPRVVALRFLWKKRFEDYCDTNNIR
jgi:hypothetical protein